MQFQRILIAIDNSPHSLNAAKKGFELAQALNASVGVAYIIDIMKEPVIPETGRISESTQNISLAKANRVIDKLVKGYPLPEKLLVLHQKDFQKRK
ncbi:MAG: universal stress protein [Sphingobacteriales bacterium]|nr:universal stress protein [Sphingobacteriales bacterium]